MDKASYKEYNIPEITRILLEMRDNCIRHKSSDTYDDPKRQEKYEALNDAIDLLNNPSKLPRWISVEERLPEDDSNYIVWNGSYINVAIYWGDGRWWPAGGYIVNDITHWMPLPEGPEEG